MQCALFTRVKMMRMTKENQVPIRDFQPSVYMCVWEERHVIKNMRLRNCWTKVGVAKLIYWGTYRWTGQELRSKQRRAKGNNWWKLKRRDREQILNTDKEWVKGAKSWTNWKVCEEDGSSRYTQESENTGGKRNVSEWENIVEKTWFCTEVQYGSRPRSTYGFDDGKSNFGRILRDNGDTSEVNVINRAKSVCSPHRRVTKAKVDFSLQKIAHQ